MSEYRTILRRDWLYGKGQVNWIMLNPSTADAQADDPTIRKCVGFSKRWGFNRLVVTNLFAYRATDPKDLHALWKRRIFDVSAVGDGNDEAIQSCAVESDLRVVAWGANAKLYRDRVTEVLGMINAPHCIALTKDGYPLHPCMAGYTSAPVIFKELSR
jgi:hypothetical protein